MKQVPLIEQTDEEILAIARQLRVAYQLKRTLRYATKRDFSVHSESVAEHKFALMFLRRYFLPLEDPAGRLNAEKIDDLIVFHDFGEITNGDKPYFLKTAADEAQEREDAYEIFASLPEGLGKIARAAWLEYDEHTTPEAEFVYALDKLEPCFELLDPINEKTPKRLGQSYQSHFERKDRAIGDKFPVMRRFLEVISENMRQRGVF